MRARAHAKTYRAWQGLRQRCDNPNEPKYPRYGGRGISYDPRWCSYENFLADMGKAPLGMTLERKNNDGNYNKDNCTWASPSVQAQNRGMRNDNTSGIIGVSFRRLRQTWIAKATSVGCDLILYNGPDFFEACCARKSWEARK